ncbi:MAG: hypothetical protein FJZ76_05110 [Bacteroidetes bacterium]|nr:hypothetical protein [Bacteroidota bacterium]
MNLKPLLLLSCFALCSLAHAQRPENIISELVLLQVHTGEEKTILKESWHFEAPNWSRDGQFLLINSGGLLEKTDLQGNPLGKVYPESIIRSEQRSWI